MAADSLVSTILRRMEASKPRLNRHLDLKLVDSFDIILTRCIHTVDKSPHDSEGGTQEPATFNVYYVIDDDEL